MIDAFEKPRQVGRACLPQAGIACGACSGLYQRDVEKLRICHSRRVLSGIQAL